MKGLSFFYLNLDFCCKSFVILHSYISVCFKFYHYVFRKTLIFYFIANKLMICLKFLFQVQWRFWRRKSSKICRNFPSSLILFKFWMHISGYICFKQPKLHHLNSPYLRVSDFLRQARTSRTLQKFKTLQISRSFLNTAKTKKFSVLEVWGLCSKLQNCWLKISWRLKLTSF